MFRFGGIKNEKRHFLARQEHVEGGAVCDALHFGRKGWRLPWRRLQALALVMLLALSLFPARALASEGNFVLVGPLPVGQHNVDEYLEGYLVYGWNRYDAAMVALGKTADQVSAVDLIARSKLSNASTGGKFYEYVQTFTNMAESTSIPYWLDGNYMSVSAAFYGEENLWWSAASKSLIASALEDLDAVLNGGDLGGGSGGGNNGDFPTVLRFPLSSYVGTYNYFSDVNTPLNASFVVTLQDSAVTTYVDRIARYGFTHVYAFLWCNESMYVGRQMTLDIVFCTGEATRSGNTVTLPSGNDNQTVVTPNIQVNAENQVTQTGYRNRFSSTTTFNLNRSVYMIDVLASNTPVTPPNNWPDPPSDPTPTPPTVPDPPTDTPITQPTPPTDPTPPTYPITTIYEGDTYMVADIAAVLDAMDEHCQHLQQAIYNAANDLYDSLSGYLQDEFQATRQEIRDDFGWLGSCIHDEFEGLIDYLKELFEWLAEQFDFSFTGDTYNDSTVVSWLKRIYLKLGGGEVNTRPTDPVADPKGIGKWLQDLWNNFLIDLVAIGSNGLGAVAEELQKLTTKFPFSIPWDIAALLALLSASPVAPVVDVPMWSLDDGYNLVRVQDMHIDMSVYNVYWEPVRIIEKIGFAVYLAMRTKDFMELLGLSSAKE